MVSEKNTSNIFGACEVLPTWCWQLQTHISSTSLPGSKLSSEQHNTTATTC